VTVTRSGLRIMR